MAVNKARKAAKKPANLSEKAKVKAETAPMKALPQTEPQIVNELQEVHGKWADLNESLVGKEAEVKELKREITGLEALRLKLLNMLAGREPVVVQTEIEGLDGRVMDASNVTTAEELRRHPQEEESGEAGA